MSVMHSPHELDEFASREVILEPIYPEGKIYPNGCTPFMEMRPSDCLVYVCSHIRARLFPKAPQLPKPLPRFIGLRFSTRDEDVVLYAKDVIAFMQYARALRFVVLSNTKMDDASLARVIHALPDTIIRLDLSEHETGPLSQTALTLRYNDWRKLEVLNLARTKIFLALPVPVGPVATVSIPLQLMRELHVNSLGTVKLREMPALEVLHVAGMSEDEARETWYAPLLQTVFVAGLAIKKWPKLSRIYEAGRTPRVQKLAAMFYAFPRMPTDILSKIARDYVE